MSQLCAIIGSVDIDRLAAVKRVNDELERVRRLIATVGDRKAASQLTGAMQNVDAHALAAYILKEGGIEEKRDLLDKIRSRLTLMGGNVSLEAED